MASSQKRSLSRSDGCGEKQLPTKYRRLNTQPASGEYSGGSHSRHPPDKSGKGTKLVMAPCSHMKQENVVTVGTGFAEKRRQPGSSEDTDIEPMDYESEFTSGYKNHEEPECEEMEVDHDEVTMSPTGDNGGGDGGTSQAEMKDGIIYEGVVIEDNKLTAEKIIVKKNSK